MMVSKREDSSEVIRGLFLDRDGVILRMVADPDHGTIDSARRGGEVQLTPGIARLIRIANGLQITVACATNQPGLAKGSMRMRHVREVHHVMREQLDNSAGARIDLIAICPHHPEGVVSPWAGECNCRKPRPGLLDRLVELTGIARKQIIFVGDGVTDIEAGRAAGLRTAYMGTMKPYVVDLFAATGVWPDHIFDAPADIVQLVRDCSPAKFLTNGS